MKKVLMVLLACLMLAGCESEGKETSNEVTTKESTIETTVIEDEPEDVETIIITGWVSQEYIEELQSNSKVNIYFGNSYERA